MTEAKRDTGRAKLFQRGADAVGRSKLGRRVLEVLSRSTALQRLTIGGPNPIHPWEEDERFKALAPESRALTMLTVPALYNLYPVALGVEDVPGDVAEVGVYRGGTALLLSRLLGDEKRELFFFDTFEGMPETHPDYDKHLTGDFADTSLAAVQRVLTGHDRTHLVQGLFPATAGVVEGRTFALAHVDVDIYQSVLDCSEYFYRRMTPGGAIVYDDYGQRSCPGARRAVDEFYADRPEHPIYLPTGQCVVWRLPS
jgi:O-methyltransferase